MTQPPQPQHWPEVILEAAVFLLSITYLLTGQLWALVAWEAVSLSYLGYGLAVVWDGQRGRALSVQDRRAFVWWSWLVPLLSSLLGASCAVTALLAQQDTHSRLLAIAASLGVILSWALLQVGFAHIYQALDSGTRRGSIRFPDEREPCALDYLYFSFTVGTSFATSDPEVTALRIRRVVLIHSVLCFFYNALVVAVAFQVLQGMMTKVDDR